MHFVDGLLGLEHGTVRGAGTMAKLTFLSGNDQAVGFGFRNGPRGTQK